MINELLACRPKVLFIELAGLLHDVGKLSSRFLDYRQTWHPRPNGYNEDPHDQEFLAHETLSVPDAFQRENLNLGLFELVEPDFSIAKAINRHTGKPSDADLITRMLQAADGIDSAFDRNNPLWSAEQIKEKGRVFRSSVFGFEGGEAVDFAAQDKARKELYLSLNKGNKLSSYLDTFTYDGRLQIHKAIRRALEQGLSDTTRPQNDTNLWEHSYAVASILKALTVHNLFENDKTSMMLDFPQVSFGVLGIGWNGMAFLSYGQKIRDILGRKNVIDEIQRDLRKLFEYTYPIGNEIYADDDGIYFVVPTRIKETLPTIWLAIEEGIYRRIAALSRGELQPYIADSVSETNTFTALVMAVDEVKTKAARRFDSSSPGFHYFSPYWVNFAPSRTVCSLCRLRPAEEDSEGKLCEVCRERREGRFIEYSRANQETVFLDEIVDESGAAVIAARFVLDDWLKGDFIRSLFVTEAKGIENEIKYLGKVKQFEADELEIKAFFDKAENDYGPFDYRRITADIDAIRENNPPERARHTAFLYDRRVVKGSIFRDAGGIRERWASLYEPAKKEHGDTISLNNVLNAKTPTASTILDVWNTTLKFFRETVTEELPSSLSGRARLRLGLKQSLDGRERGTFTATIEDTGETLELLRIDRRTVEVIGKIFEAEVSEKIWNRRSIKLARKDGTVTYFEVAACIPGHRYFPCRTFTISPNLFMAIVPSRKAVEASDRMYSKYIDRFGKVMGRLPFSIGNIFFERNMPLFVVIDAAKRMVENFDTLAQKEHKITGLVARDAKPRSVETEIEFSSKLAGLKRTITWNVPCLLGNGEPDYYHPHQVIKPTGRDLASERRTYFPTIAGAVIHVNEIKENDTIIFSPNYYDFHLLDSNRRRYDLNLDSEWRRNSTVARFRSRPMLLDELSRKVLYLWRNVFTNGPFQDITDSKLRNLQTLWLTKYQEWEVSLEEKEAAAYKTWSALVVSSLDKEFGARDPLVLEMIENGTFFDALELFLGILKDRIDAKKGGGGNEQAV